MGVLSSGVVVPRVFVSEVFVSVVVLCNQCIMCVYVFIVRTNSCFNLFIIPRIARCFCTFTFKWISILIYETASQ